MFYTLDKNKNVIKVKHLKEVGLDVPNLNFRVAETIIGDTRVSTVFLGIATNITTPPLVFETMLFKDGGTCGNQNRYATWEQAELGHKYIVEKVKLEKDE